jgi:hypothetical protein
LQPRPYCHSSDTSDEWCYAQVLQPVTNATSTHDKSTGLPLRFVSEGQAVEVLPQDTTRHVVAGIAMALAGVAAPTERWNPLHSTVTQSQRTSSMQCSYLGSGTIFGTRVAGHF